MVAAPAARRDDAVTDLDDPTRKPVSTTFRLVLAGVLAVLLVAATTWFVVAALDKKPFGFQRDGEGTAATLQQERGEAMSRAREFVLATFTYSKKDLDADGSITGYVDRLKPLLTSEAAARLDQDAAGVVQLIKQGFSRTTTIDATGVQSLDEDAAEVLVTGTFDGTASGEPTGATPFQMVVELDKVHGEWLVKDLSYVGGEQP